VEFGSSLIMGENKNQRSVRFSRLLFRPHLYFKFIISKMNNKRTRWDGQDSMVTQFPSKYPSTFFWYRIYLFGRFTAARIQRAIMLYYNDI